MAKSLVSAIVLNYNGAHLLEECLQSLLDQDYRPIEILVVDNASADNSKEIVSRYAGVRWIELPHNGGLGPGYNTGAKEATGEKLFFVNNDMRFAPDCVSRLVEAFRESHVCAVDPLQMDWEGERVIHGAQRFRLGWRYLRFAVPFLDPYQDFQQKGKTEVPWGCAGALMFDRKKFEILGGFDQTFFLDHEDLDICWRGWLRGWKTLFVPASRIFHKVGESEDIKLRTNNPSLRNKNVAPINSRRRLSQCKNAQRFVLKTMPWILVIALFVVDAARVMGSLLLGRPRSALLRVKATVLNVQELPEIFRERRTILRQSVTTSSALLRSWGRDVN